MKKVLVVKNAYFDSVFLMLVSKEVKQIAGIRDAALVMATDVNLEILREIGFLDGQKLSASPNDLVIALEGLSAGIQSLRLNYYEFFSKYFSGTGKIYAPVSLRKDS